MSAPLPAQALPRITQKPGQPAMAELESREGLLIVSPAKIPASLWQTLPAGKQLKRLLKDRKINDLAVNSRIDTKKNTRITLAQLPVGRATRFELLTLAGRLAKLATADSPRDLTVFVAESGDPSSTEVIEALVAALLAAQFRLPNYQSKQTPLRALKSICIVGYPQRIDLKRVIAEARGNNLARWLTALPPNKLDTKAYISAARALSKTHGWKFEFLGEAKLAKLGAGAFLAVSQGNPDRDAGIVRLSYRPGGKKTRFQAQPDLALIGKGIIFDTGGTNLKPFKAMLDMHHDMAGSAVALGALQTISELELPIAVDCWLAITENRLSNEAYKSRDIVTASNGTTIEVIHTDAEGRMALADTLALAGREHPAVMIDFATLTGTCVSALTERYSGAFASHSAINNLLIEAGRNCGERVWPFPLDDDFDDEIKSTVADVLQCATAGGGDHIQAARFLKRFVPKKSAWIHIDLSAASRSGGLAHIPSKVTGFGVRFATELVTRHLEEIRSAAGK